MRIAAAIGHLCERRERLHLHGADNPTYLKGDGDKTQVAVGFALLGFALLQVTRGLYNMSNGVGKNS